MAASPACFSGILTNVYMLTMFLFSSMIWLVGSVAAVVSSSTSNW